MGNKYIIDLNPDCVEGEYLRIPARIAGEEQWLVTKAALTPYTEPDTEKVREEAYEEGYRRAFADVREEHVCQTCAYFDRDENEEPCVRCPRNFLDQYTPKQEQEQIQVGDEVIRHYKSEYAEGDDAPSIFLSEEYGHFRCLAFNGRSLMIVEYPKNQYRKTGRHFPEIAAVLAKMKEES